MNGKQNPTKIRVFVGKKLGNLRICTFENFSHFDFFKVGINHKHFGYKVIFHKTTRYRIVKHFDSLVLGFKTTKNYSLNA